jgi:thiamine biosynthesis lipoprotein
MLNHRVFLYCLLTLAVANFASCRPPQAEPVRAIFALDTVCIITLFDQARPEVYEDIFTRIREIESRMSAFLPDSDIKRINAAAGIAPVQVHDDVFMVIERALYHAELSGGAFDPTIRPVVSLWGIGGPDQRIPSQEEIDAVLPMLSLTVNKVLYS